jgi:hypothetical protein
MTEIDACLLASIILNERPVSGNKIKGWNGEDGRK